MRIDPKNPRDPDRDRTILSKGHGCLALYASSCGQGILSPSGELDRFCSADGILGGHPDAKKVPGVEASTGALGHGSRSGSVWRLTSANGEVRPTRVFVVSGRRRVQRGLGVGSGDVRRQAPAREPHRASSITTSTRPTAAPRGQRPGAVRGQVARFGFAVREELDGHEVEELRDAFLGKSCRSMRASRPQSSPTPSRARGCRFAENNMKWHHKNKVTDQRARRIASLSRDLEAVVPCVNDCHENVSRNSPARMIESCSSGRTSAPARSADFKQGISPPLLHGGISGAEPRRHVRGDGDGGASCLSEHDRDVPHPPLLRAGGSRPLHAQRAVRLIANGGGVVYAPLGPTHLATEDLAIMRALPNMTIVAPADAEEAARLMSRRSTGRGRSTSVWARAAMPSSPAPSTAFRSAGRL